MFNKNDSIMIFTGHGDKDNGASNRGLVERVINLVIGQAMYDELKNNDFNVYLESNTGRNGDINYEMSIADKYKLAFSIHVNAYNGQAEGFEIFCNLNNPSTKDIANKIMSEILPLGFKDRGIKSGNHLGMVGKLKTNAILVETGFIDNDHDRCLIDTIEKQKEIGKRYARAYMKHCGVTPKEEISTKSSNGFYRVVCGSYKEKANAERTKQLLEGSGFSGVFLEYKEV